MLNNKNNNDTKIKTYIDNLFSGVGESQQLFDLKEELATNMKEKIADYQSRGMDDEQAFKEAVISMGDLSGLVDEMRKVGQDMAKQSVYSTMTARISTAGIVAGVLLVLFGLLTSAMLYFMNLPALEVSGAGIFIVAGGALLTYSTLTRETRKKYGMNKIRAALYALSIGLILFSLFVGITTRFSTGETYTAISSFMVFFLAGFGLFLFLILTGTDRRKEKT
ncbi:permease prefix domain 1-containing protein [Polycladomyces zharkentensis]|nr:permease prefix domain 1-containing protein [Polycladomyces sp. WAk]